MQERLKEIRRYFNMTQAEFAKKLGIGQSTLAMMEVNKRDLSDRHVKTICAICGINEEWLRTGKKPMFALETTFSLDQFVKDHGGTDLELEIVKAYFSLPKDVREAVMEHFKAAFSEKIPPGRELTTDECEAEYKKSVLCSAQKKVSSALNTTEDTANKKQA